jgi:general secretion pathway protein H
MQHSNLNSSFLTLNPPSATSGFASRRGLARRVGDIERAFGGFSLFTSRRGGFTLIELIVVLFIISLSLTLIMPSVWRSDSSIIKKEARHISSTLRYIYDEAVSKRKNYLITFDIDNSEWRYSDEKNSRDFRLKDHVELKDIVVPSHGEISDGELTVKFGPLGPQEPMILHLIREQDEYTIIFNNMNGKTKIYEGYRL